MSSTEPATPASGPLPLRSDAEAPPEAVGDPDVMPQPEADSLEKPSRGPKRRPCFHCGAMTSAKVLEKTGDLCWRCYRPVGYSLVKNLLVLTVAIVALAAVLVSWKVYFEQEGFLSINFRKPPQDYRPREFTSQQKIQILKRHLLERVPAKELCDEYEIPPSEFARWKEQFFDNAEAAFDQSQGREPNATERRAQVMEQKIQVIDKVLADLRENLNQLKKESGKYDASAAQRYILESSGPPPREGK